MKAIILTKGKIATVDDEDFERVNRFKWTTAKRGPKLYYGYRRVSEGVIQYLHTFISGFPRTDHKNGDGLDCQKENLRPSTKTQNGQGFQTKRADVTSEYRGVHKPTGKPLWTAKIQVDKKSIYLGQFEDETEAARAYDQAARKYFREFAAPNFPE